MSGHEVIKSETLKSEKKFEGKIIEVYHNTISLPDGRTALREIIKRGFASAIVPLDNDGNIIFVKQYRAPADDCVIEIPAGMFEKGEDPKECALRELEEETSFKAGKIELITKMYSAIGFCDEQIYIYLAENLTQGEFNFDDDEFIEVLKYPVDDAVDMVLRGEIVDSKTIIGVLACDEILKKRIKK